MSAEDVVQNRRKFSEAYAKHQFQTATGPTETSIALKQRVLDTFQQLTEFCLTSPLKKGVRLLDLGSGDGAFVECCKRAGVNAQGLDISDGVNFEHDRLPFEDNQFDFITGISVIEHLLSPAHFMEECRRILKPGGQLILVTPNFRFDADVFYDDPTHVKPYTEESLRQVFQMFGYQTVNVVPWLVKKPKWMWELPYKFEFAKYGIPFRGDSAKWIPSIFKGKSGSLLGLGTKS